MSRDITVTFDDGTNHIYQNAPDDVTPEQVTQRAQKEFAGKQITHLDGGKGKPQGPKAVDVADAASGGIVSGLETAATMATSAVAPVLGNLRAVGEQVIGGKLGSANATEEARRNAEDYEKDYTYQPRSSQAKSNLETIGKAADLVKDAHLEGVAPMLVGGESAVAGARISKAGSVADDIKGRFAKAGIDTVAQDAEKAIRDNGVKAAREAGYVLPPSQANPTLLNGFLEGVSGKVKTAQGAAIKNQAVTDGLVRKALGLKEDAPITPETLKAVRDQAGESYAAISNIGTPFKATVQYHEAIDGLANTTENLAKKFPKLVSSKEIDDLKSSLKVDKIEPEHAVELMKILREKASDHLGPMASGQDKALGRAYRKASDAVEQMVEANLAVTGRKQLLDDFRQNRQLIAKTYTVEKALNGAGHVDANNLAAQLKRGKPLSGDLKTVAKFASQFPKAAKTIEQVGSHLPIDALDGLAAIGSGLAAGHIIGGAAVLARPAIRGAILSKPGQALLVGGGKVLPAAKEAVKPVVKPVVKSKPRQQPLSEHVDNPVQKTGTNE
jgi:hypothetical protein